MAEAAADRANQRMVDRLIADGALWSRPLIAAFRQTPRHRFLERVFQYQRKSDTWREILTSDLSDDDIRVIYSDRALITRVSRAAGNAAPSPISSSSQPSLMAQMLEELKLSSGLRVLEIGAGTGYNAALIAHVVDPVEVTSIDVDRAVLADAWDHLRRFPERQVALRHADGRLGFPSGAPFDRIVVTAATPDLEPAWLEQLDARGLLQAPLALAPGLAYVLRGAVSRGVFHGRLTRPAYFMPLRAEEESGAGDEAQPPQCELHRLAAPWAGWFERKGPRLNWLGFSQSIAFYGLLRGLKVYYRALDNGQPVFGVAEEDALCWYGPQEWHVSGPSGRDVGLALWRLFLQAGGPRPTEFRLLASPTGGLQATRPESYVRHGVRCQQLWQLTEPRDRPMSLW